ncbi:SMP-30/gluconolactonase/LRE family protein [Sphingomonas sp. QA11]|uniref:SMP-30/gluconolactonase/LRE family protein n=1 Tax=Sphingomonas sp. QA11 TaxID=2950605 RepID=UPI003FA689D1|nr:SMP-30/gluconolactonase/LRE family protein [Sphingomonas sp. QA11]
MAGKIVAVSEAGAARDVVGLKSLPLSFDFGPDGQCYVVNAAAKRLQTLDADALVDVASLDEAEYGYNEIVVDDAGHIYLNNINFAFPGGDFRPGFIALVRPDGSVERQAGDLAFPNGMVITPDGKTLICAESFNGNLTAFDIQPDGTLTNRRLWAKIDGQGADGICLDETGAIWATSGPRCLRLAAGGEVLDEVPLDRMAFACMLGGRDGRTLFICANEWTGSVDVRKPSGRLFAVEVQEKRGGFPR